MRKNAIFFAVLLSALSLLAGIRMCSSPSMASERVAQAALSRDILHTWYRLTLELVRHTPTYSPPVASRAFAYLGVTSYEAVASGNLKLKSLAGQLNGLRALSPREAGQLYSEPSVLLAATAGTLRNLFGNTGPIGHRAIDALEGKLRAKIAKGVPVEIIARSEAYGQAIATHINRWAADDGGALVENMGFPDQYKLVEGGGHWLPTSLIVQQQKPLLPDWGQNRPFAMPVASSCALPAPPTYSEDRASEFYLQALEVYQTNKILTSDQRDTARFWSDDVMLSPTPSGHWISIALQILDQTDADVEKSADILARIGIVAADAFIGCWNTKFEYDLVRPVTYIRKMIDPKWEPLLPTPPFPEYPSGHSTQSAAIASVMTQFFGRDFAFEDRTGEADGLAIRRFTSFEEAAEQAAISRLYGGIHFRAAIQQGLTQGRCIGAFANNLQTSQ